MGLTVVVTAFSVYLVYLLLYLAEIYNNYMFDRVADKLGAEMDIALEFDYIIIGGGTAGSLIATRMLDKNVLVLEAGASQNLLPELPIFGPMWQGSMYDWNYVTEPQTHACKAMENNQSRWPRGKIFGGSFLLSNLIHNIGAPDEYRAYVDPNTPFDYDTDIGQYFREYEALMDGGEVPFRSEFSRLLKLAGSEIDFHGFQHPNVSVRNGFRFTTATLYRQHAKSDIGHNHTLLFNAMVTKMLLGDKARHVAGVEFMQDGQRYVARARKAVILSAGAIGSPQILLHSGIGPKNHLDEVGIETKVDLPVGKHLIDHLGTGLDLVSLNSTIGTGLLDIISAENLFKFLRTDGGLIAMPGCDLVGRLKVLPDSKFNDLEFMVIPIAVNSDYGVHIRKILNIKNDVYYDYFHDNEEEEQERQFVTILPVLLQPKSEGEIRLRSKDPAEAPIIDPKYLTHPDDRKVLYEGIKLIKRLVETESLQKLGAKIKETVFPGCAHLPFDGEAYWMCYIEQLTVTSYHPAGTCKMGACPIDSVVDYHFKVHGVDNLYVVDASVMPQLPSANPIATINMLALRFVDRELD